MEKMNINITTEYIKLDQLLKFSALAESGAMAKDMIFDGIVSVNGEVCTCAARKFVRVTKLRSNLRTRQSKSK